MQPSFDIDIYTSFNQAFYRMVHLLQIDKHEEFI